MKSLSELIVTRMSGAMLAALKEGKRITELHLEREQSFQVGNIYIGKIQSIVKNIQAAFVDFGCGCNGYLPLDKVEHFFFTRQARAGRATCGDELLVQLEKEPVKTKLPVLTGIFNLGGRYAVWLYGETGVSFSRKIRGKEFEEMALSALEEEKIPSEKAALIVRTNAAQAPLADVVEEIKRLKKQGEELLRIAPYRSCFSCLYHKPHPFLERIRDYPIGQQLELVTDIPEFYEMVQQELGYDSIRLYEDTQLSLTALYSLETALEQALSKRVWLKSGGYLILEVTEALTVIDVNTGKNCDKKSNREQHFLHTNLEAAGEIALQLRLRNYSGMVLVDFIDMKEKEHTEELLQYFRQQLSADRVKTTLVDMTALNLAEVTRKRIYRPLHEAVRELEEAGLRERRKADG